MFYDLILGLFVDVHDGECVLDVVELDEVVEGSIGGETRSVIDLEDDWFGFVVDHHVEP